VREVLVGADSGRVGALFDHERAAGAVRELLLAVGEDPDRDGLRDTPDRVARSYAEIFPGTAGVPRGCVEHQVRPGS
jgi:GTP cyclohydrolase I